MHKKLETLESPVRLGIVEEIYGLCKLVIYIYLVQMGKGFIPIVSWMTVKNPRFWIRVKIVKVEDACKWQCVVL